MGDKRYTAQEMRDEAKCFESRGGSIAIAAMLRQAADAMEREEREKKRKKRYEYGLKYEGGFISRIHSYSFFEEYQRKSERETILRREVGEWEEVEDGK